MNNHTSRFMNDGILWTDVFLRFVLLGSLPTAFHLFLPFLVHFYPSYISIQQSLIAVLELFTNRDFDPALPGCWCAASESPCPLSQPTAVLPKPTFPPWHCLFPLLSGSHNPPRHQANPEASPLTPHCSEPNLEPADSAIGKQHGWHAWRKGRTPYLLAIF